MQHGTWPFQRHVGPIQAHTNGSTRLPKGEQPTEQSGFVFGIAITCIVPDIDWVGSCWDSPTGCQCHSVGVGPTTFLRGRHRRCRRWWTPNCVWVCIDRNNLSAFRWTLTPKHSICQICQICQICKIWKTKYNMAICWICNICKICRYAKICQICQNMAICHNMLKYVNML